jgi:hypothetical protein
VVARVSRPDARIAYEQNLTLLNAGTRVLQARAALGIAIGISYP